MRDVVAVQASGIENQRTLTTLIVILFLVMSVASWAADGDLDPQWDGDGMLTVGATDTIYRGRGIAVQCDGKVVVAGIANASDLSGNGLVARFNPDGSLDTSFATGGIYTSSFGNQRDTGWDLAIQLDGKIVMVGSLDYLMGSSFLIVRLTADGDPDPTFGNSGAQEAGWFFSSSAAHGVALQDDGRIVVVGRTSSGSAIGVARLTAAGGLDATFQGDGAFDDPGLVSIDFLEGDDIGWDVAIQDDGRIVVVGSAVVGGVNRFAVVRLLETGALDPTFGTDGNGKVTFDFGDESYGHAIAIQPDGKIVVAGSTDYLSAMAVARLTTDGDLDPMFNRDGKLIRDFGFGPDEGWDVALQGDGRILVAGSANVDGLYYFALVRYRAGGIEDTTFGGAGYSLVSFESNAYARGVAVHPHDRRLMTTGYVDTPGLDDEDLAATCMIGDSGLVFASGFECGDSGAWSGTIP